MGITSLILGIIGLLGSIIPVIIILVIPIIGLILGIADLLRKSKQNKNTNVSIIGIVLCTTAIGGWVIMRPIMYYIVDRLDTLLNSINSLSI